MSLAIVSAAAGAHLALQTTAQVVLSGCAGGWRPGGRVRLARRVAARVSDPAHGDCIDWELVTGAGIIGLIHAVFYYRETQQRALREAQLETRLIEAQLQTLQHQLHPHFLFNTLHAISTLMHRDLSAAERMLVQLGDLLRHDARFGDAAGNSSAEEIEFLEKYVQIEQVRLGDRLTTLFDIETDVLDAAVPTLILQPLVENAIEHGIAPLGVPGRITVSAKREHDMLVMTVDDTGPGPSERAMAALFTGIGLSNTRARLDVSVRRALSLRVQTTAGRVRGAHRASATGASVGGGRGRRGLRTMTHDRRHHARSARSSSTTSRWPASGCARCSASNPTSTSSAKRRNGLEAVDAILDRSPDLVFLDVHMPKLDGFEVIETVGAERMPAVVFVTAYDQHALRAFEVQALDYLLKPFDGERFQGTLRRVRRQMQNARDRRSRARSCWRSSAISRATAPARTERLVVKSGGRLFFLRTDEIDWIEAAGNYVRLHVGADGHLLRETMTAIESQARPRDVLPHPPLAHRQHRADQRAAAVVQRRVRRHPAQRHEADAEPRLSRAAAGETGKPL